MFIFSDMIIHGLCRFIYNLVAVLYNDILLFKNMKRQGAFWPSGVDFGLYYNNFALILQQSCAPGLFPRPGRQGALIFWYVASLDKGTYARRTLRHAFRCVIVLDIRRYARVLCLAKNAPECPAGLRVFPEDKRQLARQTRQMGCRPSMRITKPDVV